MYHFYSRADSTKEPISRIVASSRYRAAIIFSLRKGLNLKEFLRLYAVSR